MYSRAYKAGVTIPPLLWVDFFSPSALRNPFLLQLLVRFIATNGRTQLEPANYAQLFRNPLYLTVLLRSIRIAGAVTLLALLLGYPLAYYLSFSLQSKAGLLYQLVIIPLWASYLVRGYAWKTILGSDGVLNGLLQYLHVTHAPLSFCSTVLSPSFSRLRTSTRRSSFLPIYASLEHVPRNLVEASHDLGASPFSTFRRVILPLSLPGFSQARHSRSSSHSAIFWRRCWWVVPVADDFQHRCQFVWRGLQLAPGRRDFVLHVVLVVTILSD